MTVVGVILWWFCWCWMLYGLGLLSEHKEKKTPLLSQELLLPKYNTCIFTLFRPCCFYIGKEQNISCMFFWIKGIQPKIPNISKRINIKFEGLAQYLHRAMQKRKFGQFEGRGEGSDKTQLYSYTIPPKYLIFQCKIQGDFLHWYPPEKF